MFNALRIQQESNIHGSRATKREIQEIQHEGEAVDDRAQVGLAHAGSGR
jgi:hypothetical protein